MRLSVPLPHLPKVSEARWSYRAQAWSVALTPEGDSWAGDRIWLATGCKLDVQQDPLLSHVIKDFPIQVDKEGRRKGWNGWMEGMDGWMEGDRKSVV